ncbi:PqiC family protein [Granulosicoccus antarcticus]|uniref:ABC-type transport auxiliary lipoprotein component domain-containing protein n=1 Tax=Granulosicoccus antarcticus IMCC3135 TaxID=1192854 RepID=A0A2Z2NJM2_9GAMM|nr:ABC-type transport auxiliary lipoprotein family protein [Granulosicoccus antarcticus]ASJ71379.1 hypothetical protein IMCC3135_06360 [Granulosicoccus antarcticus IMCC3135]
MPFLLVANIMNAKFCRSGRVVTLLLAVSFLSACGSVPQPRLYLLESPAGQEGEGVTPPAPELRELGVVMVSLPGYAVNAQIASLATNGSVTQDNDHRWAEDPAMAINRLLVDRLRKHADTTVLTEPWPRDYRPTARVKVVFDRLLREPSGGADMSGQVQLLSGDGRKLLKIMPFEFVLNGQDTARQAFFVAVSQGVDDIARMAIEALQQLELKS